MFYLDLRVLQIYQQVHYRRTGTPRKPSQSGLQLTSTPRGCDKDPTQTAGKSMLIRAGDRQHCCPCCRDPAWPRYLWASPGCLSLTVWGQQQAQHQTNPLFHQIHQFPTSLLTPPLMPKSRNRGAHLSEAEQFLTFQGVTNAKLS